MTFGPTHDVVHIEQAEKFFARSTHLQDIVTEIKRCMASVPTEHRALLWSVRLGWPECVLTVLGCKNVIISGGRAVSLAIGIDATLRSGSANVINGARSLCRPQQALTGHSAPLCFARQRRCAGRSPHGAPEVRSAAVSSLRPHASHLATREACSSPSGWF